MNKKYEYFAINKPYGVLSQFTDSEGRKTLKDLYDFPPDVYPIGRLDLDSEGLLLLTNDKTLTDLLLNPKNKHEKEYLVQVEGIPDKKALKKLEEGVLIKGKKTKPAKADIIDDPGFSERIPPIRERKNIPVSWIRLIISEGMNRQVRKMTAAEGHPTLRLVRVRIKTIELKELNFGEVRELTKNEIEGLKMK